MRPHKPPVGLALFVLFQGPIVAILRALLALLPLPEKLSARWQWKLRKGFWNNFARFKFRGSKEQHIPIPRGLPRTLTPISFRQRNRLFRRIPITNVQVADRIPWDEKNQLHQWLMRFFTWFQVKIMYRILSPMQEGLDSIPDEPYKALDQVYPDKHRALFEPPIIPLEYIDSIDLGALAVKGPYHGYLKKYQWGREPHEDAEWQLPGMPQDNFYEWDFRGLDNYEHHEGLYHLGCRVLFAVDRMKRTLSPIRIKRNAAGLLKEMDHPDQSKLKPWVSKPNDETWPFAKKLALCAATNYMSLVTHFNGIHLAAGAHLAIATRNHLYPNHVVCRLLWPYIYHTQLSNFVVSQGQMVKGGDFESIFSFTHQGMCDLFSKTYLEFDFTVNNPEADATSRGIVGGGFDTPTQDDLETMFFGLFKRHARKYLEIYFDDAGIEKDDAIVKWLEALNETDMNGQPIGIPNGVRRVMPNITVDNLAGLLASFMYMVTVRHDLCGSFLWNYQSWPHKQPPRIYRDGRNLPLDVYQRLMNANFNLNVPRTLLLRDPRRPDHFAYLASDHCHLQANARKVWHDFMSAMADLDSDWRTQEPWHVWRVYPSLLEMNIND